MKSKVFSFICFCLFTLTALPIQAKRKGESVSVFKTEIHCQSCVKEIEDQLAWEKGVTDLKCDIETQTVAVTYKTKKTNDAQLIKAFAKIEKEATLLTQEQIDALHAKKPCCDAPHGQCNEQKQ